MTHKALVWIAVTNHPSGDDARNLLEQRNDLLALCENRGWEVVEILEVPIALDSFLDFRTCVTEMQKRNINAFAFLEKHWEAADFDVLVVRDQWRFAPTHSLFAYIVERTITEGAAIYSGVDGLITEDNYRVWVSMVGFGSFEQFTNLKKRRERGLEGRLRRGLPLSTNLPASHIIIREERTGKALRVGLNPDTTPIWDNLAELILEGLSWRQIGKVMDERFGYKNADGKAYPYNYFYRMVYNPVFWGHGAMNFKHVNFSSWVYDEAEPVPASVTIYRNIYPAIWEGEKAEQIKAELRKREHDNSGKKKSSAQHLFDGLFLCAECGKPLKLVAEGLWTVWRCSTNHENDTSLKERYARQYIDKRLGQMVEEGDVFGLLKPSKATKQLASTMRVSQNEIDELIKQLTRLLLKQASIEDAILRDSYDEVIQETLAQFQELQKQTKGLWEESSKPSDAKRQKAYERIAESLDKFWSLPTDLINQTLLDLMGNQRFVVANGEIVGIAEA